MYITNENNLPDRSFEKKPADIYQAGREFVDFIKSAADNENSTGIISLGNKEYDLKNPEDLIEYKKSLLEFARGIIDQTRENRKKSSGEDIKVWEVAGLDKPLPGCSMKDRATLKLFEICDFSYDKKGNLLHGKGNGITEEMDLALLIAYTDAKDGKVDAKTDLATIKHIAATSLLFGKSYRKSIEKNIKKINP